MLLRRKQTGGADAVRRLIARLFPERQIVVRADARVSYIRLSRNLQLFVCGALFAVIGWGAFTSVSFVVHDKVIAAKDEQIRGARVAYKGLLTEVAEYQRKFLGITRDLEENHGLMLGLIEQNAALQKNLTATERRLRQTATERDKVISAREHLRKELAEAERSLASLNTRNSALKENLDGTQGDLQTALSERNQALTEGNKMRRNIRDLEGRLSELQQSQEETVKNLTERAVHAIDSMERVVQLTGIEPDALLAADDSLPKGQGGPFISAGADNLPAGKLKNDLGNLETHLTRWQSLQSAMQRLPLAAPLTQYTITSAYGKRRDPFNKRWSAHYGVDFGGVLKTTVFATAAGTVTFAGYKGKYGRLVEIEHGAGVKTRYGHLYKAMVKKGDKVSFGQPVGLLGNSGRSTGAHLHYEVAFQGKPKDPMKFIKAGGHVFQE